MAFADSGYVNRRLFLLFIILAGEVSARQAICSIELSELAQVLNRPREERITQNELKQFIEGSGGPMALYVANADEVSAIRSKIEGHEALFAEDDIRSLMRGKMAEQESWWTRWKKGRTSDQAVEQLPGPKSTQDFIDITETYRTTEIGKNIAFVKQRDNEFQSRMLAAQTVIRKFEDLHVISDEDLKALRQLEVEYNNLRADAEKLDRNTYVNGVISEQIAKHLEASREEIITQLKKMEKTAGQQLVLNIPVRDPVTGELKLKVLLIKDYGQYVELLKNYNRKYEAYQKTKDKLDEQARKYLQLRHIAGELSTTTLDDAFANSNTSDKNIAEFLSIKTRFTGGMDEHGNTVPSRFNENDPTTPSLYFANRARRDIRWENGRNFMGRRWKEITGTSAGVSLLLLLGYSIPLATERNLERSRAQAEDAADNENIENPDYWIAKCENLKIKHISFTQTEVIRRKSELLFEIIYAYRTRLSVYLEEKIRVKRKMDPAYVSLAERERGNKLYSEVLNGCLEHSTFAMKLEWDTDRLTDAAIASYRQKQEELIRAAQKARDQVKATPTQTQVEKQIAELSPEDKEIAIDLAKKVTELLNQIKNELKENEIYKAEATLEMKDAYQKLSDNERLQKAQKFMKEIDQIKITLSKLDTMRLDLSQTQKGVENNQLSEEYDIQLGRIESEMDNLLKKYQSFENMLLDEIKGANLPLNP